MTTNEELEEIYLERLRYLTSIDDMRHQMLEDKDSIIYNIQVNQETSQGITQGNDIRVEADLASA